MGFQRLVFIIAFLMFSFTVHAVQSPDTETIPDALEPWKSWVLHGEEEWFCPSSYNDERIHHCVWPSVLEISIDHKAGHQDLTEIVDCDRCRACCAPRQREHFHFIATGTIRRPNDRQVAGELAVRVDGTDDRARVIDIADASSLDAVWERQILRTTAGIDPGPPGTGGIVSDDDSVKV